MCCASEPTPRVLQSAHPCCCCSTILHLVLVFKDWMAVSMVSNSSMWIYDVQWYVCCRLFLGWVCPTSVQLETNLVSPCINQQGAQRISRLWCSSWAGRALCQCHVSMAGVCPWRGWGARPTAKTPPPLTTTLPLPPRNPLPLPHPLPPLPQLTPQPLANLSQLPTLPPPLPHPHPQGEGK